MSDFITLVIVNAALGILALLSVVTWILILHKTHMEWRVAADNRRFTSSFWGETHAPMSRTLPRRIDAAAGPNARVARAAFDVLSTIPSSATDTNGTLAAWDRRELLERSVGRQVQRERRRQEQGLTLLASIANVAPFVGLFGTVFGIIHAMHSIATGASSGVTGVAAPVGQALVATGIGIAVAIPAALAYNAFVRRVRVTTSNLEDYALDVIEFTERHVAWNDPAPRKEDDTLATLQNGGVPV
jgi:biopolymer transport protein ExbB